MNPWIIAVSLAWCMTAAAESPPSSKTPFQEGSASWYGEKYHGRLTASGEKFDMHRLTAAHRSLPFGTWVRVTDETSGRWVDVRINDRGPYSRNRILDLSYGAAKRLGLLRRGHTRVRLQVLDGQGARQAVNSGSVSSAAVTTSASARGRSTALPAEQRAEPEAMLE